MRTDKGPAMTAQTRSRRTLQAPRGAAVTWVSRGMHVGNARQRQGWAGAAQGAHGSRQGTKCSQRRHDRTEPVRGYQPIEVPSGLAFQRIPLASLGRRTKGRARGVARTKLRSAQLCKLCISAGPIFPKLTERCSVCNQGWALPYSPNGQALKNFGNGAARKICLG
jgi:hypothetical protein